MFSNTSRGRLIGASLAIVLSAHTLHGQHQGQYRDFALGSTVSSIVSQVQLAASDARVLHERPALLQELQWRTPYFTAGSSEPQHDPVQQIVFTFYNDQLFRMVIDYDRQRTEGMTDADMIEAFSAIYGPASTLKAKPAIARTSSRLDVDTGRNLARWGDASYSVGLFRSSLESGFQAVVTSTALDAQARTADAQAVRLDERTAPAREIARQKKADEDARVSQEKARAANKAAFKP
jgi:hypothetical protein